MTSSKSLGVLAALALILMSALSSFAAPAAKPVARSLAPESGAKNLLINPGFERGLAGHEWMPAGWDTSDAGLSTVFFGRDSLAPHSGRFSVNVANTSTVWPMSHNWSQTVLVGREAWGKDVVLSAWTRSSGLDGRAYVMVQAYRDTITRMARIWGVSREEASKRMMINPLSDPLSNLGWKRAQFEDANTDWVRREARIHVPEGTNVIFARLGVFGTGQVSFDDASLVLAPAAPEPHYAVGANLLEDPGFEAGATAWEWSIPPFEGATIARDSSGAHGGRVCMELSNMNNGPVPSRMGMSQTMSTRGLRGRRVRITGWFKGDSLVSNAYVKIMFDTHHGLEQSPATQLLSMTFPWTPISTEVVVPEDADQLWAGFYISSPAAGRCWIDDCDLTIVPDEPPAAAPPASGRKR